MIDGNSAVNADELLRRSLRQNRQGLINHVFLPAVTGADVITAARRSE
jgi:hypothetical protein